MQQFSHCCALSVIMPVIAIAAEIVWWYFILMWLALRSSVLADACIHAWQHVSMVVANIRTPGLHHLLVYVTGSMLLVHARMPGRVLSLRSLFTHLHHNAEGKTSSSSAARHTKQERM
jgi:hypothetical protein